MEAELPTDFKSSQKALGIVVFPTPALLEDALVKEYFRQIQKISAEEALAREPRAAVLRNTYR